MRLARKILLWLVGLLVAALVLVVGALLATPSDTISGFVAAKLRAETGREVAIEGPIKRRLFPYLGFETGRVTLANAEWAGDEPLFSAESVKFGVAIGPLFSRRLVVQELILKNPTARLVLAEDGRRNTAFEPEFKRAPDEEADGALELSIERGEIEDGVLIYENRQTGKTTHIADADLVLAFPGLDLPLSLQGEAVVNGRNAMIEGELDNLGALQRGEKLLTDFVFAADGALIRFDGAALLGGAQGLREARGALAFQLSDDLEQTDWLRRSLPPRLDWIGAVDVAGELRASPRELDLDLSGFADYNTVRTEVVAKAKAEQGWLAGRAKATVSAAAKNDYFDLGYEGLAGLTPAGGVFLDGDWRARIEDGDAFARWVDPTKPLGDVTLLQRFDVTGDIAFLEDKAAASVKGALDYNDRRATIAGELSGGGDWRTGGVVETFLEMREPELLDTVWTGELIFQESGPQVEGDLTFATTDVSALRHWFDGLETPAFYKTFVVQGRVAGGLDKIRFEKGSIQLNDIETAAEIEAEMLAPRPMVRAELSGGPFDLTPFLSEEARAQPSPQSLPPADWSDSPFDFSALTLVDADLTIDIAGFRAAPLAFGPTRLSAALRDGRVDAALEEMELYGGRVEGEATLDAGAATPQMIGALEVQQVRLGSVLAAFGRPNILYGDADLTVKAAGQGRSMNALMRSLSGQGAGEIADGKLLVINFAEQSLEFEASLLGARQEVEGETPFADLSASFTIEDGVLRNGDMRLTGPVLSAEGEGSADLGARRVDYLVTPTRFGESSFLGIDTAILSAFPVAIRGPFHALVVGVDRSQSLDDAVSDLRRRRRSNKD